MLPFSTAIVAVGRGQCLPIVSLAVGRDLSGTKISGCGRKEQLFSVFDGSVGM